MRHITAWLVILCCVCTAQCLKSMPALYFDLDSPAESRFTESVNYVLDHSGWDMSFGPVFAYHNTTLFSKLPSSVFITLGTLLNEKWPEYASELRGISNTFISRGHYVTYDYLATWSYFHELGHANEFSTNKQPGECSAAIVRASDGTVYHGRNMDQVPTKYARNLSIHHVIRQRGVVIGWMSAMSLCSDPVGMQENWRFEYRSLSLVLESIKSGKLAQRFLFREMIIKACTTAHYGLSDAIDVVNTHAYSAGMFVVMSSYSGGVIVSISVNATLPTYYLGNNTLFPSWFMAQTNTDPWLSNPVNDPRRASIVTELNQLNEDLNDPASGDGVIAVMSTDPQGSTGTVYTLVMKLCHDGSYLHAYVQDV